MRLLPGGMCRLVICQAVLCLGVSGQSRGATVGNVVSYAAVGQDVTFEVQDGSRVCLTILAPDTVRVRIAPGGTFSPNVSRAVVSTDFPPASYSVHDATDQTAIDTAAMHLLVRKQPFVLECRDSAGNLVVTDDPVQRMQWDSGRTEVFKSTQSGEKYVGLGWRTGGLVRNGTVFSMRNTPTYGDPTVFYAGVPLWYGIRNGKAYGIFFDDASWGTIDLAATSATRMSFRNLGGQLEYYYFAGPDIAIILDRYTQLTGRPFMPPRWALGYQQSRWSYYPQTQVLDTAQQLRSRSIPCDVIYLDIDYMPGGRALTFDQSKFPDPAVMLSSLHAQGFRVVTNVSPFLFLDDPKYATARDSNYVLRRANGSVQTGWHDYWYFIGGATTGSLAWLDFSKTAARNWWAGQHAPFISQGIDGIWNDENEPNELGGAWPADLKHDFDGSPVNHNRTSNQYCLLETQLSYDILRTQYPTRRPFVLSRGGFAGIQRCSAVWSGDNRSDWTNDFKQNIPMGLAMSISGNPHNGHDIGGFFNQPDATTPPSGELYARWMEAGVFSPFCRQHHDGFGNHGSPLRPFVEPWMFGATVESICRDYIGLRYRLMPYLYTLFHQAHASGSPVQRPTLYDFPADPATLTQDYDFMVGPYLLVSPVTAPGASEWATYLPAGTDWIGWWDDALYAGGQTVTTSTPLDRVPIFLRAGAIIPTRAGVQFEGQTPVSELTLDLYPTSGNDGGEFTLYEDDGISWSFESGDYAETHYAISGQANTFTLQIAPRQGQFTPAPRNYLARIHRWPIGTPAPSINGVALPAFATRAAFDQALSGYFYDDPAGVLYARFPDSGGQMTLAFDGVAMIPADFDRDEDVDQEDFGHLQSCLTGPGIVQDLAACADARLDADSDVDDADVALFLGCFSGAGEPGSPTCLGQ